MNAAEALRSHRLPSDGLEPVRGGTVNEVWATRRHLVRVGRAADHPREARLANRAAELGVRTARAVAWGYGYSIWERLPGTSISQERTVRESVWGELLDDLEVLHERPLEPYRSELRVDKTLAPRLIRLSEERAQWTRSERNLIDGLLSRRSARRGPTFIHGDAYARNVLINEDGAYVAIIDWGCTGWASLEGECARLEDDALELAKQRWRDRLDIGLLERLRLELVLQVLVEGRIGVEAVRQQLETAIERNRV